MLFWKRPHYAHQVLEHLSRCKGIEDYELVIQLDGPVNADMQKVCSRIQFARKDVQQFAKNMGCNFGTKTVLDRGFKKSDYVLHVEEDVILAPDALRYFEWAKQFGDNTDLLNIAALHHPKGWFPEHGPFPLGKRIESRVQREGAFSCWGWATWRDRWDAMEKQWTTGDDRSLSWDVRIEQLRRQWNMCQLMPHVSRIMNIGAEGGVHRGAYFISYWAGSPGFIAPSDFFIVS